MLYCKNMLSTILFTANTLTCQPKSNDNISFGNSDSSNDTCLSPTTNYWQNLTEASNNFGLNLELPGWTDHHECNIIPGGVVAQDLNKDGWDDLLFLNHEGSPWVYQNVNGERLVEQHIDIALFDSDRPAISLGALDLTGDGLPDLIQTGVGYLAISENLGEFQFDNWELLINESGFPYSCFGSFSAGDLDQDGDLDIVLAGTDLAHTPGVYPGTEYPDVIGAPTLLIENTSVGWEVVRELSPWDEIAELSVLQILTDYDNDGDLDIISSTDRSDGINYPPMAVWNNSGALQFNDIAEELGVALPISGMGLGSNDLNKDGLLDYCISDVANHLICLLSTEDGFYLGGESLGLEVNPTDLPNVSEDWTDETSMSNATWSGWSIIMQDLNNDGLIDIASTAGAPPDYGSVAYSDLTHFQPDWVWMGTQEGYKDLDPSHPFINPANMYGMVSVDLDRDGHTEIIKAPASGSPELWKPKCTDNNWIEIDLLGIDQNIEAYGAKIFTTFGNRTDIQEIHGLVTMGQSPSLVHVGLGSSNTVDNVEIWWPDGERSYHSNVPINRRIVLKHPSRLQD
jgi:hypothetical protein